MKIPNMIPYLILALLGILLSVITWLKGAKVKYVPLHLCIAGLIYVFEFVVLVLFASYEYDPGIFAGPYFDNVLGSSISNGLFLPSLVAWAAVSDLGIGGIALLTVLLVGTEEMFIFLGVYRHYWWKTMYTGALLPVVLLIGQSVWYKMRAGIHRLPMLYALLGIIDFAARCTASFYLTAFFHAMFYRVAWYAEPARGHIAFSTLYIAAVSLIVSLLVTLRAHWLWYALCLAGIGIFHGILYTLGILQIPGWWGFGLLIGSNAVIMPGLVYVRTVLVKSGVPG